VGKNAEYITENHNMDFALNEQSPLGKIYELNGFILMLGAPADSNTSLHLAEYRQENTFCKEKIWDVKVEINNEERWTTYQDINNDSDDFDKIFADFQKETNYIAGGKVGDARSYLIPMMQMVEYAVKWMNANRG
jgi:aminoglycoside 3-N-acetyltransferase